MCGGGGYHNTYFDFSFGHYYDNGYLDSYITISATEQTRTDPTPYGVVANWSSNTTALWSLKMEVRGSSSTTDYVALPSDFTASTDSGTSHYTIASEHLYRDGADIGTITGNGTHNIAIAFNAYAGGSYSKVLAGLMDSAYYFDSSDNPSGYPYVVFTASAYGKTSGLQTDFSLQPVNDAPVAISGSASSVEGTPTVIDFAALTSDVDTPDSGLTIEISAPPAHGTLGGSGLSRTYTPDAGYGGADALTYRVYDGSLYSEYRTVNLTVTAPKHPPVATDDSADVAIGKSINIDAAHGVLANDADADGDALSVAAASTGTFSGDYGTLTLKSDGSYTYASNGTQAPVGTHAHDRFGYTLGDGQGGSSKAVLDIGIDRAPVAEALSFGLQAGTSISNNSYGGFFPDGVLHYSADDDGDALSVTSVSAGGVTHGVSAGASATIAGTYGTLTLAGDGSFAYAQDASKLPAGARNGRPTDTFGFTIGDGHGGSDATTVTFYINRSPTASDDTASATRGIGATVSADAAHGVLANDVDLDRDAIRVAQVSGAGGTAAPGAVVHGRYGDLTLNADGSYTYVVTDASARPGDSDVFTYAATDDRSLPGSSTLLVSEATLVVAIGDYGSDVWKSGIKGDWSADANWVDGSAPTIHDNVTITGTGNPIVTITGTQHVQSLTETAHGSQSTQVDLEGSLILDGRLNLGLDATTDSTFSTSLFLDHGASLEARGGIGVGAAALLNLSGGTAFDSATVTGDIDNAGWILVGQNATATIDGSVTGTGFVSLYEGAHLTLTGGSNGQIDLSDKATLTLKDAAHVTSQIFLGSGTAKVDLGGAASFGGSFAFTDASEVLDLAGVMAQSLIVDGSHLHIVEYDGTTLDLTAYYLPGGYPSNFDPATYTLPAGYAPTFHHDGYGGTLIQFERGITQTWMGTYQYDWQGFFLWDSGRVPNAADAVVIPSGAGRLQISTDVQAASLTDHDGGDVTIFGGGSLTLSGALTIDGYAEGAYGGAGFVLLDGASVKAGGGVTIGNHAIVSVASTHIGTAGTRPTVIDADVRNDGYFLFSGSDLVITGDVTGTGFFARGFDTTIELMGASTQTIYLGDTMKLVLDHAERVTGIINVEGDATLDLRGSASFGGSIYLFNPSHSLDLVGITSATLDGTTLHATRSNGSTLDLTTYFAARTGGPDAAGPDFKLVTADDGHGGTVISFESTVEHAPVAYDLFASVQAGSTTNLSLNQGYFFRFGGSDVDYDPVTVVSLHAVGSSDAAVAFPALGGSAEVKGTYGTLFINGVGDASYVQDTAIVGMAGRHLVDHFEYTVSDGRGGTDVATADVSINRAATPADDATVTIPTKLQTLSVDAAHGVLANDTDPDGDRLHVVSVTSSDGGGTASVGQSLGGPHGYLTLNSDGSYTYDVTLRPTVSAEDTLSTVHDVFTYTVIDEGDPSYYGPAGAGAGRALKTATLDIAVAVNHAAQAKDDTATVYGTSSVLIVDAAHGLLANDTDRDGDTLRVSGVGASYGSTFVSGEYGDLNVGFDGSYSYTVRSVPTDPDAHEHFTYMVSDQLVYDPFGSYPSSTASLDIYFSSGSPLVVVPGATAGNDTLRGNANADIAELIDGKAGDDRLFGFGGDDHLIGGLGNDYLDGGTGADLMEGGAGNDSYFVDNTGDRVIEAAGGGADTVYASISYALAAGEEIETLRANAGTTGLTLTGNEFANTLISGAGDDILIGGAGNDVYAVNTAGDQVIEAAGGGQDTVNASVSYALGAGQEIEILRANAGTTGLTLTGNELANTLYSGGGDDTLIGGAGNDAYYVNSAGDRVVEALGGGTDTFYASVNYTLGAGQDVEILRANAGTTGLTLTGNELANTLISGGGDDTLIGGAGNDTYAVNSAGDRVIEAVGGGTDTINASVSYTLGAGQDVEILRATAGAMGITLAGNELANKLYSGGGDDILVGGAGNDSFYVNSAGDRVIEALGGGNDTVYASVSYALGAGQEIETLRANAGTTGLTLTGNELANTLISGGGDDTLIGGAGNDIYAVNSAGDQVIEAAGGGQDTVNASVSFTLGAGQELEILRANAGTMGITLTGNELANKLYSGGGDDTLIGGDGNDIYYVNSAGDHVVETLGGGTDTVYASVNYALDTGQEVEFLRANAGTTGLTLTGNELANTLVSGSGDDTLIGGGGNDVYAVNSAGDRVIEGVGGGSDTVNASVSYTLGAGQEIEFLRASAGTTGLTLTGNALANAIVGGAGDDVISGGGGADILRGNAGSDTFVFKALSDSVVGSGRVTIADFTIGNDHIDLSAIQAITGAATDQAFTFLGTQAFTRHAGELHQVASGGGTLIEGDVDGNGTADFQIALTGLRTLHATDFVL